MTIEKHLELVFTFHTRREDTHPFHKFNHYGLMMGERYSCGELERMGLERMYPKNAEKKEPVVFYSSTQKERYWFRRM